MTICNEIDLRLRTIKKIKMVRTKDFNNED